MLFEQIRSSQTVTLCNISRDFKLFTVMHAIVTRRMWI